MKGAISVLLGIKGLSYLATIATMVSSPEHSESGPAGHAPRGIIVWHPQWRGLYIATPWSPPPTISGTVRGWEGPMRVGRKGRGHGGRAACVTGSTFTRLGRKDTSESRKGTQTVRGNYIDSNICHGISCDVWYSMTWDVWWSRGYSISVRLLIPATQVRVPTLPEGFFNDIPWQILLSI